MQTMSYSGAATPASTNSKLLSSMAILQVNWEHDHKSYLDNFLPFILEAIRRNPQTEYNDANLSALLLQEFAMEIPESVIHSLLRRAKKAGIGDRNHAGNFVPNEKSLNSETNLAAKQADMMRQQRNLVDGFIEYAKRSFDLELTEQEASLEFVTFVETYAPSILGAAQRGEAVSGDEYHLARKEETALASYVECLNAHKPVEFGQLVSVVKGAMLASSIFRDQPIAIGERFENTHLYLDTRVIFRALGYYGSAALSAELAMINGAKAFGASVRCFEDTLAEVSAVIESVANSLGNNRFAPDSNSIGLFFLQQNFTAEEVRSLAATLERDLRRIGIEVAPRPSHSDRFTVDEEELARIIQGPQTWYSKSALNHDVDVLTAIFRIRKGRAGDRIERSWATFITTNPRVIIGAERLADFRADRFPVAMFEDRVSTLVWLKTPLSYPDLPRDQIVARVSSLLSPTQRVWTKYIEQVERLRARGSIDESDEILLRQHYEAGRALVEETYNDPSHVTEYSVNTVLKKVKDDIKRPLQTAAADLRAEHALKEQYLETQAQLARQENNALVAKLSSRATAISARTSNALYWSLVVILAGLVGTSLAFHWQPIPLVVQGLMLVALLFGSILEPLKAIRERGRKALERLLRTFLGLENTKRP